MREALHLSRAARLSEAVLPDSPGCYVLIADAQGMDDLGIASDSDGSVLYVGKAEDSIRRRVSGTHLVQDRSGSSTLRRSVGALLRKQLGLDPQPRSDNPVDRKRFTNYRFDPTGELALSAWIGAHVSVVAFPCPNPAATERGLVAELRPALNLTGWQNPARQMIKEARAKCAGIANNIR